MSRRKDFNSITAVYTTAEEKELIVKIATRNNTTQSEVLRLLLLAYTPSDEELQTPKLI
jgi:hypothetical protein